MIFSRNKRSRLLFIGIGSTLLTSIYLYKKHSNKDSINKDNSKEETNRAIAWIPPTRKELLERLKNEPHFDLLIIGAGATGSGCALDAAQRGLNTLCVDQADFASGTSSKSTKLVHGGVRYLEAAFKSFSLAQFQLVQEALEERGIVLKNAPHICGQLPIMLPVYDSMVKVIYYWMGAKVYDAVSWVFNPKGAFLLDTSYHLDKFHALKAFPMLKEENLKGAVVYYDGRIIY